MNITDIINSGDVELYVYGVLGEAETATMAELASEHKTLREEIISVEDSLLRLSSSFSPAIPADLYGKIKSRIGLDENPVLNLKAKRGFSAYIGWAAAILLLFGLAYQYQQQNATREQILDLRKQGQELRDAVATSEKSKQQTQQLLDLVRDGNNTLVNLSGQTVAPNAFAKVYWNQKSHQVYVDAAGLPAPPKGKVYQVWALQLSPALVPTSIGLLEKFDSNSQRIFAVSATADAQAFGITLEPEGGSKTPTLEQLYTLGKV